MNLNPLARRGKIRAQCLVSAWRGVGLALFFGGMILGATPARAQAPDSDFVTARSISGQIIVTAPSPPSRLFSRVDVAADTNYIRLEPALLAIAAERFKISLWQQLGLSAYAPWSGKIFLVLHPAQSLDDGVTITGGPFLQAWDYRVTLPDVITRTRYARSLAAVFLLEIADRSGVGRGHSAEIPAWLADGLARTILAQDTKEMVLSAPNKSSLGALQSDLSGKVRGLDTLAFAHHVLENNPALTFDALTWPTDRQVNGEDGGVYLASAQLFVHELLRLDRGPEKIRAFLAQLSGHLNWQTAFFSAFQDDFQRPLDVEKWWALRVVAFAAHDPGPRRATTESNGLLAELLSVPATWRTTSNSLPVHVGISLQTALRNFSPADSGFILETKIRDLEIAQFRLGPPFNVLAAQYRRVLVEYLGGTKRAPPMLAANKHASVMLPRASLKETVKKLDALDAARRETETRLSLDLPAQNRGAAPH
jgi:hypothetical protein